MERKTAAVNGTENKKTSKTRASCFTQTIIIYDDYVLFSNGNGRYDGRTFRRVIFEHRVVLRAGKVRRRLRTHEDGQLNTRVSRFMWNTTKIPIRVVFRRGLTRLSRARCGQGTKGARSKIKCTKLYRTKRRLKTGYVPGARVYGYGTAEPCAVIKHRNHPQNRYCNGPEETRTTYTGHDRFGF